MFAETYDPENDADEDEGAAAIFPKSDEQRARLIESVKNILLFRSLDKEQVGVCDCSNSIQCLILCTYVGNECVDTAWSYVYVYVLFEVRALIAQTQTIPCLYHLHTVCI